MKTNFPHSRFFIALLMLSLSSQALLGQKKERFERVEYSTVVDAGQSTVWGVISDLEQAARYDLSIDESLLLNGLGEQELAVGLQREAHLPDGNYNIILTEELVDIEQGRLLVFEMVDSENLSLKRMRITLGLRPLESGKTELFNRIEYIPSSRWRAQSLKRKFEEVSRTRVLSYSYYLNSGEPIANSRVLEDLVKDADSVLWQESSLASRK